MMDKHHFISDHEDKLKIRESIKYVWHLAALSEIDDLERKMIGRNFRFSIRGIYRKSGNRIEYRPYRYAFQWLMEKSPIETPPGSTISRFAKFFLSKKSYERCFEPLLADLHEEYFDALDAGCYWKCRWIKVRYFYAFLKMMGLNAAVSLIKTFVGLWKIG